MDRPVQPLDSETMRLAMRRWASGITVVTSIHGGERHGMTVSSFTSVSLTPPLVLVALEWGTRTHRLVKLSNIFGVTILSHQQHEVSDRFAGRQTEYTDRFHNLITYSLTTGASFLAGGLAGFDCRVVATHEAGNHTLFIGEVLAAKIEPDANPLIYYNRSYRQLNS